MCKGNVGRSQMAEALFRKYSKHRAMSAGTKVFEGENQKLKEIPLAEPVIRFIKQEGTDISENVRTQITPNIVEEYDKIIIMAEKETVPEFLSKSNKVIFWDIEDPKGKSDEEYKELVKEFIKENNL